MTKLKHLAWILAGLGITPTVFAHSQGGTLGTSASATDYYTVTCSDDGSGPPAALVAQVQDLAPVNAAALVSVTVNKGNATVHSTDNGTDGDAVASPLVSVSGGAGVYNVYVAKSNTGAETYTLTAHCNTAGGVHTGTSDPFGVRQNQ